jgi:hypothetical protein
VADRTYKQWYEYHLALLKKDPNMKNASANALKILAGDQAQRSFDAQEKAKKSGGTLAGSATAGMDMPAPLPTPNTGRVGPGSTVPAPTITKSPAVLKPTATPTTGVGQVPANATDPGTYNNRMQSRIQALGIQGYTVSNPKPIPSAIEFLATLNDAQYAELAKVLKGLGYGVKEKGALKNILINYFEEVFPVKDYSELLAKLKGRSIAGTGEDEANLPDRRIGQIDRGTLIDIAQSVANKGMFKLTEEELNEIIAPWEKKLGKGTLTTTKKVRNPKTGKMENVTTTTAAFRQQEEEKALEQKLRETRPQQFELATAINFDAEFKKILAGGA